MQSQQVYAYPVRSNRIKAPLEIGDVELEVSSKEKARIKFDYHILDATIQREESPGFKQHFSTNVLCNQCKESFFFMLPAYVRLNFQGMTAVQIASGSAKMNAILIISVYFGDLPKELVDLISVGMHYRLNSLVNLSLTAQQFKDKDAGFQMIRNNTTKVLTYIVRGEFPLDLECSVRYVPFDVLDLKLKIELPTVYTTFLGKQTLIDFNIMYAYKKPKKKQNEPKQGDKNKKQQQERQPMSQLGSSAIIQGMFNNSELIPPLNHTPKKNDDTVPIPKGQHFFEQLPRNIKDWNQKYQIDYDRVLYFEKNDDFNQYGLAESKRGFRILPSRRIKKQGDQQKESRETLQKKVIQYWLQEQQIDKHNKMVSQALKDDQNKRKIFFHQIKDLKDKFQISDEEAMFRLSQSSVKLWQNREVWNTAEFSISLYRDPFTFILTVFLPTILLALFTLAIFFQSADLGSRIASLATLLVAYTTFLPTIRSQIPPTPAITIFEFCLYGIIATTILCLIRSYIDNFAGQDYIYEWQSDIYFIISLVIVVIVASIMLVGFLVYKCCWERQYNDAELKPIPDDDTDLSNLEEWHNPVADINLLCGSFYLYFLRYNTEFFTIQKIFYRLWDFRVEEWRRSGKLRSVNEIQDQILISAQKFYNSKKKFKEFAKIITQCHYKKYSQPKQGQNTMVLYHHSYKSNLVQELKGQTFGKLAKEYEKSKQLFLREYLHAVVRLPETLEFRIISVLVELQKILLPQIIQQPEPQYGIQYGLIPQKRGEQQIVKDWRPQNKRSMFQSSFI